MPDWTEWDADTVSMMVATIVPGTRPQPHRLKGLATVEFTADFHAYGLNRDAPEPTAITVGFDGRRGMFFAEIEDIYGRTIAEAFAPGFLDAIGAAILEAETLTDSEYTYQQSEGEWRSVRDALKR